MNTLTGPMLLAKYPFQKKPWSSLYHSSLFVGESYMGMGIGKGKNNTAKVDNSHNRISLAVPLLDDIVFY